jgi:hydrogenase-4 component F
VFNHAVTKAFMFFCAGSAVRVYGTNDMNKMRGMIQLTPFAGIAIFLGAFALGGMPPFSIFMSEVLILIAGFVGKQYVISALMLLFLAVAFAGLVHHISKLALGSKPQRANRHHATLSTKIALLFLGIFILVLGLKIPHSFFILLSSCQKLIVAQ